VVIDHQDPRRHGLLNLDRVGGERPDPLVGQLPPGAQGVDPGELGQRRRGGHARLEPGGEAGARRGAQLGADRPRGHAVVEPGHPDEADEVGAGAQRDARLDSRAVHGVK
ncbi:MAG: hypothetical protein ACK559_10835, partial [bacterium]